MLLSSERFRKRSCAVPPQAERLQRQVDRAARGEADRATWPDVIVTYSIAYGIDWAIVRLKGEVDCQNLALQAERLQRQEDRAARGEADHGLQGLLLYALSTIFMSAMMILVKLLGAIKGLIGAYWA